MPGLILLAVGIQGLALELDYPTEVYASESFGFSLRGQVGLELQVTLDGERIASANFEDAAMQLTLRLEHGGALVFEAGGERCELRVVSADASVDFEERDGFLYSEGHPAILLLDHRHPPKHDRTWEGWKLVSSLFSTPDDERIGSQARLGRLLPTPETAFYDLHALILELPEAVTDDLLLLRLSPQDLKHGISDLSFRMRLEWILQRLQPMKRKQLVVMMVYEDRATWTQFKYIDSSLRLACRSHGTEYEVLRLNPADHRQADAAKLRIDARLDAMFELQGAP